MIYKDLHGKTALVTGASQGIGKAIAEEFAKHECRVIALYKDKPPTFDKKQTNVVLLKNDVRDIQGITDWLRDFSAGGGKIDVLINNAGIYTNKPFFNIKESDWDNLMDVNLKAMFFLSQIIATHMKENGGGNIVNAASFAAKIPSVHYGVYAASKSAVISLTKSMAAELAPYNIRVNSYSPGVIPTQMTQSIIEALSDKMIDTIALHRFGTPTEVARAVLFLCSDASSYITGADLDVSGGKFITQNPSHVWNE